MAIDTDGRTQQEQQCSIRHVEKRDGRQVVFYKAKIADAIYKAAQAVGGEDRVLAEELAGVVTMFLEKN